jgi:hypothetical protein
MSTRSTCSGVSTRPSFLRFLSPAEVERNDSELVATFYSSSCFFFKNCVSHALAELVSKLRVENIFFLYNI